MYLLKYVVIDKSYSRDVWYCNIDRSCIIRAFFFTNPANLPSRIFDKSACCRAMFSNFHQKDRITIFLLLLSLYVAGEQRVRGELSQNQNNSIDGVARITRGATISARWGAKTSHGIRKSIVTGIIALYFSYRESARSILLAPQCVSVTISTRNRVNFIEIF